MTPDEALLMWVLMFGADRGYEGPRTITHSKPAIDILDTLFRYRPDGLKRPLYIEIQIDPHDGGNWVLTEMAKKRLEKMKNE